MNEGPDRGPFLFPKGFVLAIPRLLDRTTTCVDAGSLSDGHSEFSLNLIQHAIAIEDLTNRRNGLTPILNGRKELSILKFDSIH